MISILRIIGAYLCLGIIAQAIEEMILVKKSKEWFGEETETDLFGIFGNYKSEYYFEYVIPQILTWPIGIAGFVSATMKIKKHGPYKGFADLEREVEEMFGKK